MEIIIIEHELKWKVRYNTACAENTEKRLESKVKLHRIITEVHKIMFQPHQNLDSCHFFFFDPRKTFWTHATHITYAKVCLTPPTNPCTHSTHATHDM